MEQGGVSSSDLYKIFAVEQLALTQKSSLGIKVGDLVIYAIGQEDDTAIISNSITNLFYMLELTKTFCMKYQVDLSAEKTKLQAFSSDCSSFSVTLAETPNPIKIYENSIPFTSIAEHVGMVRSTNGNGPTILGRFTAHRNALAGILLTGVARNHRQPCF